jgi:hypothetical protein
MKYLAAIIRNGSILFGVFIICVASGTSVCLLLGWITLNNEE